MQTPLAEVDVPKISVVIPCYNAERFIARTVESVLAQTLSDLELICVNNNSTDGTADVLARYAEDDARIRIVDEPEPGEGPARDAGRASATGEWLYFLDADDLMEPTLLEEACRRGERTGADLVIFRTAYLDDQTGERRACDECFVTGWIGSWEAPGVFSPRENPSQLFTSFQNWVHNKLYRASFVREHGLAFQHVHRMADILFTCRALAEADRVALLDKTLHLYRTNNPTSALFTTDSYPLDFYEAFLALKASLEEHGIWELYRDTFVNWAEEAVAMNLYRAGSFEGFSTIARTMKDEGLARLDILGFPAEKALFPLRHKCCEALATHDLEQVLFLYFALERRHMSQLETELSRMRESVTHRVGRAIVAPLAKVHRALFGGRRN